MKIALATDHAGFKLKEAVKAHLVETGREVLDFGTHSEESCDYSDFSAKAAVSVARGESDVGVVFCGSSNGVAITANKVHGIRCSVCWNEKSASATKEHNNANIIALGGHMVSSEEGIRIVEAWLGAEFQGGRHQRRIDKIAEVEKRVNG